ncbi:MAG: tetratricopeptide repeat protein, partial [Bacteroidota bacterium]
IKNKRDMANTYLNIGICYEEMNKFEKALKYYENAIELSKQINDLLILATGLNNKAIINKNFTNYEEALSDFHNAINIYEKLDNKEGIGKGYNNIANIYNTQKAYDQALIYYAKAEEIFLKLNHTSGLFSTYNNIGIIYYYKTDFEQAVKYYYLALEIAKGSGNNKVAAYLLNNIGMVLYESEDYNKAEKNYNEALQFLQSIDDKRGQANIIRNMAMISYKRKNYKEALNLCEKSLKMIDDCGKVVDFKQIYESLSIVYEGMGNYAEALKYYRLFNQLKDSLYNEEVSAKISEINTKYETDKKEKENELLKKDQTIKDLEITHQKEKVSKQKILIYSFIIGLVIVLFFSVWLAMLFIQKRKANKILAEQKKEISLQKEIVDEKNQEILDSINYARRIQSAILPHEKVIKEYLKESFILYKPKDIVAGDFYWLEHADGKVLFAAADCTGHGVPGAMVSVVCNNALNRSVREHGLSEPGKILDKAREIVIQEFEKSDEEVKDGMDIALCSLSGTKLLYAGANNPLWIVRNNEILETKANKQPIGKSDNPEIYTTHSFELQKGDSLYIFSDGFVDQFGGKYGKKFKAKALRELLLRISDKSVHEQKLLIDDNFENWKGGLDQVDDVLIIGIKI